jgi:hypothetical protein
MCNAVNSNCEDYTEGKIYKCVPLGVFAMENRKKCYW